MYFSDTMSNLSNYENCFISFVNIPFLSCFFLDAANWKLCPFYRNIFGGTSASYVRNVALQSSKTPNPDLPGALFTKLFNWEIGIISNGSKTRETMYM